jgi:excisionase family DNA binding protein
VTPRSDPRVHGGADTRPPASHASGLVPRLLSARDAATYLAIGYETVLDLVKAGTLRPVRLAVRPHTDLRKLLFDRADLDRLVEASKL